MTKEELFKLNIDLPNQEAYEKVCRNWDAVAKPIDGLGDFEKIIAKIGAIKRTDKFSLTQKLHVIMCADNGVVSEGVSQTDKSVTLQVAKLMGQEKSSVGRMAAGLGNSKPDFEVYDVGIDSDEIIPGVINAKIARGTADMAKEAAMSEAQAFQAIEVGIQCVKRASENGYSIISTGEMGIGNTTTSTALLAALTGLEADEITGRGAGLSDDGLAIKKAVISSALKLHRLDGIASRVKCDSKAESGEVLNVSQEDAFRALTTVGGFDIAALTGVFIGGGIYHIPIVIDGVISAVSALLADSLVRGCRNYAIASHEGKEQGVMKALKCLGLEPVIKGNLALGEGTGAIMLYPLLDMAMSLYSNGTGFDETSIAQYERFEK